MPKLIVVLGATGKQGGSVIERFLKDPEYEIRAVTRDPSSESGKALVARGVEVVQGDLLDLESLKVAFKGANVIYAMTTDFWTNLSLVGEGTSEKSALEKVYDMELKQGQNITEAALTILHSTLELFIFSTLSSTKRISGGKYTKVYHFDAKAKVIDDIKAFHPDLAKKTAAIQLGFFANNWRGPTPIQPTKLSDGTYEICAVGSADALHPFVDPNNDPAIFAHAISKLPTSSAMKVYYGYGSMLSMKQWAALLSEALGIKISYHELTIAEYNERMAWHNGVGEELGEMYAYSAEFGFDGGERGVISVHDVRVLPTSPVLRPVLTLVKIPLERKPITMDEYIKREDWSILRAKLGI